MENAKTTAAACWMPAPRLQPGVGVAGGNFILDKVIGTGAFASVWMAHHAKLGGVVVAIKIIEKTSISTSIATTRLNREIALLKSLRHPFIAEFFIMKDDDERIYLVIEHVANGNLLEYVNAHGRMAEDIARRYFMQLVYILEYLHIENKVCHRDIKAENVLLDRYNNVRIIDFGLSTVFTEDNPNMATSCGSPAYASPSLIRGTTYTASMDIWSAGILLFAICAGYLPFDDANVQTLLRKIVYTEPVYPAHFSKSLVDLLQKLLQKDEASRITIDGIKKHPWFSAAEYEALKCSEDFQDLEQNRESIDKEAIDKLSECGYDAKEVTRELLQREFTEGTALYRMLMREKTIEKMKDLMSRLSAAALAPAKRGMPPVGIPAKPAIPALATPAGAAKAGIPGGPVRLAVPTGVIAPRRPSRPVAIRRPLNGVTPGTDGPASHET